MVISLVASCFSLTGVSQDLRVLRFWACEIEAARRISQLHLVVDVRVLSVKECRGCFGGLGVGSFLGCLLLFFSMKTISAWCKFCQRLARGFDDVFYIGLAWADTACATA